MAEQIPYGVAVGLINKLASSTYREFGRVYGVMDQLQKLKKTLESIKIVLSDAEQRQSEQDHVIQHWVCRFKQVLHDADDLLDGLAIQDLRRRVDGGGGGGSSKSASKVRGFFSSDNPLVFRHKLARKIEKVQRSFNDVAEDMSKLKLNPNLVVIKQNELAWRETSSFVLQSEIIGREENKNDIMNLLSHIHDNQNVSLIAIVGMGGLGKTALAQLVYNSAQEKGLFQKYMWVCISEDFQAKTVLNKMLKSLKKDEVGDLELDILQQKLQGELKGQRYMLVLDDVWNEDHMKWNDLRTYLMCGGQGSKIVVTTRSTMVSQTMGIKDLHVLKGLTNEQSWTLLKNLTFGEDVSRMSPSLESIGKRIAEKCGGVPLAIRTVGGFLRTMNEESDQWSSILNDDIWKLCEERQSIMPVLKLSYQKLPLGLRQCFAYCYLYPKDWEIPKNELIQLWMAQCYLESSNGRQSMEDVGNEYIRILLMRSFFQDASVDDYGDIISFKMHDLMHDLAKSIVGNDCYLDCEGKEIFGRPMHISLHSSTISSLELLDSSHLRTVICRNIKAVVDSSFVRSLKYLRVLNLSHSSITQLPECIDKIMHLKCLDLSFCDELTSLPKSIGNIVSLQTLNLYGCLKLVFSVEDIVKLINLRHLGIEECEAFKEMMPVGLGKLTSLQTLSSFVVGDGEKNTCGKLNELNQLNNIAGSITIRNLGLVKDTMSESNETDMKAKKHIRWLSLDWVVIERNKDELSWVTKETNKNSDSLQLLENLCPHENVRELLVSCYPGMKFSSWLCSLTNIVAITLSTFPNCQYLPPLERLPCLKMLNIWNMKELEYIQYEEISDVFFPSLERLNLDNCWKLRGWQRLGDDNEASDIGNHLSLPSFPRLSSLKINHCQNLIRMPALSHSIKNMVLRFSSAKLMMEKCLAQFESPPSYPFFGLKYLEIGEVSDVEAMAEDWMQNLTSLEQLSLLGSSIIPPLVRHLQHLPIQLQELKIKLILGDKLDLWKDEEENNTQSNGLPQALRSVQKLSIEFCKIKDLPEQIGDLQSLRHIHITHCNDLGSLPEAMRRLTNLQTLHIGFCRLLQERCQAETGQDWPKISHIANIIIE